MRMRIRNNGRRNTALSTTMSWWVGLRRGGLGWGGVVCGGVAVGWGVT